MKKIFFTTLLAFMVAAAGCSKDKDSFETVPTESKIDIVDGNVVRTQVGNIYGYDAAIVATYLFEDISYDHQEWKVYFHTEIAAMTASKMLEAKEKGKATVRSKANTVLLVYEQGKGLGDEELSKVNTVDELKKIVEGLDILNLFKN